MPTESGNITPLFYSVDTNMIEPNNDSINAQTIEFNKKYTGYLSLTNSRDWVKVTLPSAGTLTLITEKSNTPAEFYVYNDEYANNYFTYFSYNGISGSGSYSLILSKGTYYIKISQAYNSGSYNFKFLFNTAGENFRECDYAEDAQDVSSIVNGSKTLKGCFPLGDQYDWFKFTTNYAIDLYFNIENINEIHIYEKSPDSLQWVYRISYSSSVLLSKGTYYVRCERSLTGNYSINFNINSKVNTNTIKEPNYSTKLAQTITQGKTYTGCFTENNKTDCFKVKASKGTCININFRLYKDSIGVPTIKIYNDRGSNVFSGSVYYTTPTSYGYKVPKTGYYYIEIYYESEGKYTVDIGVGPKQTKKFRSSKITSKSVKLKWSKNSGVKGYIIYKDEGYASQYFSSYNWKRFKNIKRKSIKTFTVKKLNRNEYYFFKIVGYKKINGKTYYDYNFFSDKRMISLRTKG